MESGFEAIETSLLITSFSTFVRERFGDGAAEASEVSDRFSPRPGISRGGGLGVGVAEAA